MSTSTSTSTSNPHDEDEEEEEEEAAEQAEWELELNSYQAREWFRRDRSRGSYSSSSFSPLSSSIYSPPLLSILLSTTDERNPDEI
jgi:hypothetical protein